MQEKSAEDWHLECENFESIWKFELLLNELERMQFDIIGLCETRWKGEGLFNPDKTTTVMCSGKESGKSESGPAIVLKREARKSLGAYTPVSYRIVNARLNAKPKPHTVIQVYATTSAHDECTKDQFYDQLQATVDKVNKGDISIVMGDLKVKDGQGDDTKCGIEKIGLGERNESGSELAEFCHSNNFVITNTLFDHHKRNLYTWISPVIRTGTKLTISW